MKDKIKKFLKVFLTVPMHFIVLVILTYSLFAGNIDWREYVLVIGLMVIFSVSGYINPLWK